MTFARTQRDAVWKIGYKPTGADLIDLDQKSMQGVNGDGGGLWLPSTPIDVAGAGVGVGGPWFVSGGSANVTGQITFDEGSSDDYFRFDAGHPETSIQAFQIFAEFYSDLHDSGVVNINNPAVLNFTQPVMPGVITQRTGARLLIPLRVRNGGRVTQVVFTWQVGQAHANAPAQPPRFAVIAVDTSGNRFPLRALDAKTDSDGFLTNDTLSVFGGAVYSAGLGSQNFTYACNQNQVVDKEKYSYFAEIIDESGSNSWASTGNTYMSATVSIDQITLLDGRG